MLNEKIGVILQLRKERKKVSFRVQSFLTVIEILIRRDDPTSV